MGKVTKLAGMALAASFALTVVFGAAAMADDGGRHFSQFNGNGWNGRHNGHRHHKWQNQMSNGGACGGNNGNHFGWRNNQGWNNAMNNGGLTPFTSAYGNIDPNTGLPFVDPNAAAYGYGYGNGFVPIVDPNAAYGYPTTNGGGLLNNLLGATGLGNGYVNPVAGYGYGYPATTGTGISGALGSLLNNLGGAQQQQLLGY